jgi:hypothetical protein
MELILACEEVFNHFHMRRIKQSHNLSDDTQERCEREFLSEVLGKWIRKKETLTWQFLKQKQHFLKTLHFSKKFVTEQEVVHCNNSLSEFLVLSPLDRNPGVLNMECKSMTWCKMYDHFWMNKVNYTVTDLTHQQVMKIYIKAYKKFGWQKYAMFRRKGEIPYPYILTKAKNRERIRPVVSTHNHPLKKVFYVGALCLFTCLKNVSFQHSNLFSQTEIIPTIKKLLCNIHNEENKEEWAVMTYAADVKEMYTCLPQEFLLKAVWFILMDAKKHNRRGEVTIYLNEPKRSRLGKLYNCELQARTLTMEQIFQII